MKKHVADKEHSQALVEAGIVLDTYFRHDHYEAEDGSIVHRVISKEDPWHLEPPIPAPLPCELMEILPDQAEVRKVHTELGVEYMASYRSDMYYGNTPANALCDMAIWLKKEGLLEQP